MYLLWYNSGLYEVTETADAGVDVFRVDDLFLLVEANVRRTAFAFERIRRHVRNIAHHRDATIVCCVELR